ncbi:YALI0E03828p [Yarrowia lipolytica CLIB122]|jgi:translation initiation factor 3 subunit G|uniref:Eukaryotic translation initiation factor 3 subunit G n=3 Tax=Yarrowia lipolytica TaxID=4952 RepID=EIF3G_YARLI|nr:YALI0E03828p [Yarrowia lipolytica CLIB122]Q6C747.1 RecName: Full=Eukaryotic translation initiation factor 3 subunit G; Short=eIF3g; AltName: Full=Eukaryotic translation initiation factor 3 RNA-binding subunit; Short=eIF-3 RNA-binding subunit; AltName: Full=Translation initiation factor eIF3 p33 subunit homolog; Short=eIF3 p33 homolog [Yarrowia lipolytica CLIB122]AOW04915.1 hypothetical protein YALI1_E04613g [Yarrowia lipolytica]KAJ8056492.1 eIF-3 RNA-binding subunit [Yarrowia lipolytica]CAG7|eukprot:XP_503515.1 YALI0E03828p [Yarrowia lipolytica CLIB122]
MQTFHHQDTGSEDFRQNTMDEKWADDDEFSTPQITQNADGTKTIVTHRMDDGKKYKRSVTIKNQSVTEKVLNCVAERSKWTKYGKELGAPPGPNRMTTTIGEDIVFVLGLKSDQPEEEVEEEEAAAAAPRVGEDKGVKCRLCQGPHFTSKCPYKETLGGSTAAGGMGRSLGGDEPAGAAKTGGYVPPHLRNKGPGGPGGPGGAAGGRSDDDDELTLRVTNLSEEATDDDLRRMFGKYGMINRVYVAKDRDTGRPRGFAFVTYTLKSHAQAALEAMDGHGFDNLIMKVDYSKKRN